MANDGQSLSATATCSLAYIITVNVMFIRNVISTSFDLIHSPTLPAAIGQSIIRYAMTSIIITRRRPTAI